MTPAMTSTAPTVHTEHRRLISAEVEAHDDYCLEVGATLSENDAPRLHLKWFGGPWDGQTLNFPTLDHVDDLIAALEAVRDRVAMEEQPK